MEICDVYHLLQRSGFEITVSHNVLVASRACSGSNHLGAVGKLASISKRYVL